MADPCSPATPLQFLLLLTALWNVAAEQKVKLQPSSVLTLNGENFAEAVKTSPLMLVNFYAPWCGHSSSLVPELERAASTLLGRVTIAKVDASLEAELSQQYNIGAFPTLLLFRTGQTPEEFSGVRNNASIVKWVEEKLGPWLTEVSTEVELEKMLKERPTLSYFVAKGNAAVKETFRLLADEYSQRLGAFIYAPGEADAPPLVQVHRGSRGAFEIVNLTTEAFEPQIVLDFLEREALPVFGQVCDDTYSTYAHLARDGLLWACLDPETLDEDVALFGGVFRSVVQVFPQFLVGFVDADMYQEHVEETLGCTEFPTVVLQWGNMSIPDPPPKHYRTVLKREDVTKEHIAAWIDAVLAGHIQEDEFEEVGEELVPGAGQDDL